MAIANPKQEDIQSTDEPIASCSNNDRICNVEKEMTKKSNIIQEKVDAAKIHVETNFEKMSKLLDEKKKSIIAALDELPGKLQAKETERLEKLVQIRDTQEKFKKELNQFGGILDEMNAKCEEEIKELEEDAPFIELEWKMLELEEAIQQSCTIFAKKPLPPYMDRTKPIWRSENKSPLGSNNHKKRNGLAIDPENEDIFVATEEINRIEVFSSKGEFLRLIDPIEMKMPWGIVIQKQCCFVACDDNQGLILKLNKITGQVVARCRPPNSVVGITIDENKLVWGCSYHHKIVFVWDTNNLQEINTIYYDTPFYKAGYTCAMQLQLTPGIMYILFRKCDYPVQSFNREGDLLRVIISTYAINDSFHFCLDKQLNIVLSDTFADNVKVFTNVGKLLAILGKTESKKNRGDNHMYKPAGIAITKEGTLILSDRKTNNWLMLY